MHDPEPALGAEARYRRLKQILIEALDRQGSERQAHLDTACRGDEDLRQEVEALLAHEESTGDFLSTPATLEDALLDDELGALAAQNDHGLQGGAELERIGPYKVLAVLGEGGMGRVYLAEQEAPLQRRVALKVLGTALRYRQARTRFAAECAALARLSHPNIASIYEAGTTTELGYPYFAMEWVEGAPITDYCDAHRLDLHARIELFASACAGVEHAHQKGVLHRDLKPSNLLVTEVDGRPQAKVIDFGIAKAFDHPLLEATLVTGDVMIGTPAYLAPELAGNPPQPEADTRTDVYSLGILLHEIILGVRPFEPKDETLSQWMSRLSLQDPPSPNARWEALPGPRKMELAAARRLEPKTLERLLRDDLGCILLKVVARERHQRYGSAAALAADLGRYLRREPVEARPASTPYVVRKFVDRQRLLVAAGALVLITSLAGVAARTLEARRANRAAAEAVAARQQAEAALQDAEAAREEAEEVSSFLIELFRAARPSRGAAGEPPHGGVSAIELLELGDEKIDRELQGQPRTQVRLKSAIGQIYSELGRYDLASEHLDSALDLARRELPRDVRASADVHLQLGKVARRQNQLDAAETHLLHALATYQSLPGEERRLAETYDSLGLLRRQQGSLEAAQQALEHGLEIRRRVLGPTSGAVASSLNNLANLRLQQARLGEAQALYEQSLEIFRNQLGSQNLTVGRVINNLAVVHAEQDRLESAAQLFEQALAIREQLLGNEHPDVAETLNNLGVLYGDLEQYDKAEPLHRRALAIREKTFGPVHPQVAWSLDNLGGVQMELGHLEEADGLLERALEIRVAGFGKVHPEVARSHHQIGLLRERQGRLEEARDAFARALVVRRQVLGPSHPDLGRSAEHLAEVLLALGDLKGAATQARAAKELLGKADVSEQEKKKVSTLLEKVLAAGDREGSVIPP